MEELQAIEFSGERALQIEGSWSRRAVLFVSWRTSSLLSAERWERFFHAGKEELRFLDMPNVTFSVEQLTTDFSPLGQDKIQFLISDQLSASLRNRFQNSLWRRGVPYIMLAIKTVLVSAAAPLARWISL